MPTKEELVKLAKKKYLVDQAKAKWTSENAPPQEDTNLGESAVGALRSGLEGLTFGASEPVISGMMAAEQAIKKAYQESSSPQEFIDKVTEIKRYQDEYDADVNRRREWEASNPRTAMYSELSGAAAPMLFTGGAGAAAKGVTALPRAIEATGQAARQGIRQLPGAEALLASKGLGGSAARVAEGAAAGAAEAGAFEAFRQGIQKPTGFIQEGDEVPSIGEAAMFGAKFGGGLSAVPELFSQGARGAKAAAKVLTGAKEADIDAYLANPEAIRSAKSLEQIKDEMDDAVGRLADDVDNAKLNKEQARDVLRRQEEQLKALVDDNKFLVREQKAEIRDRFRQAKNKLDDAFKATTSEIKESRLPVKADDVLDSIENVKAQVSDLSSESYKILGNHKGKFNLAGVGDDIQRIQDDLMVNGQLLSQDAERTYGVIGKWKEKLAGMKSSLSGQEVKKVIQELDSDIRQYGDKMAGEFSDKSYNSLMQVRRALDERIKTSVPFYREIMEETAKLNQFRGQLVKAFGKRESVTAKLQRLNNPNMQAERELLEQLGESTGKDFKTPLMDYMEARSKIATPMAQEQLKRSLPEYKGYVDNLAENARAGRPGFGDELIEKARTASPEAAAVRKAQSGLNAADEALMRAQEAYQPYKRLQPNNTQNVIQNLMRDKTKNIELQRMVKALGDISDQDFIAEINNLRVRSAFDGTHQIGSRNVNLWGAIMGGLGFLGSGDLYATGGMAAAGAAIGSVMDKYGPAITRKVLDGMVFMKGIPTVQKVNAVMAGIPNELRSQLKADLIRTVTLGNTTGSVFIPPEQRQQVMLDIDASDALTGTQKAEAITAMNKSGRIDSTTLAKMIVTEEEVDTKTPPQYDQGERKEPYSYKDRDVLKNKKEEPY